MKFPLLGVKWLQWCVVRYMPNHNIPCLHIEVAWVFIIVTSGWFRPAESSQIRPITVSIWMSCSISLFTRPPVSGCTFPVHVILMDGSDQGPSSSSSFHAAECSVYRSLEIVLYPLDGNLVLFTNAETSEWSILTKTGWSNCSPGTCYFTARRIGKSVSLLEEYYKISIYAARDHRLKLFSSPDAGPSWTTLHGHLHIYMFIMNIINSIRSIRICPQNLFTAGFCRHNITQLNEVEVNLYSTTAVSLEFKLWYSYLYNLQQMRSFLVHPFVQQDLSFQVFQWELKTELGTLASICRP